MINTAVIKEKVANTIKRIAKLPITRIKHDHQIFLSIMNMIT